jgi:hypothetical protein
MGKEKKQRVMRPPGQHRRPPDPRLTATQTADSGVIPGGGRYEKGDWVTQAAPIRMDGEVVYYQSPEMVSFSLIEARKHRDRGERLRGRLPRFVREQRFTDAGLVLDCIAEYRVGVLLSFAAIESIGNAGVNSLPSSSEVQVERGGRLVSVPQDEMERTLSVDEKLDLVVPLVAQVPSIKGTKPWESFVRLRKLRNELVHVKKLGYSPNPDEPSPIGRLLLGEAERCVEDAREVVRAAYPTWPLRET